MVSGPSLCLTFEGDAGRRWPLNGRDAWARRELIRASERGRTPVRVLESAAV